MAAWNLSTSSTSPSSVQGPRQGRKSPCRTRAREIVIIQQILAEPEWAKRLTARDKKALTALIWAHINPYGTFHIDMNTHLDLGPGSPHAKAA